MDELATAIARIEAELAIDRTHAAADSAARFHQLAELKLAAGDAEGALAAYRECIARAAPNPLLLNNFGAVLIRTGRFDAALEALDAAVQLNPRYIRARVNRGKTLRELGRLPEATAELQAALELQADYVPALVNLGEALCAAGRFDAAARALERAARLEPHRAEARSALGIVRLQAGDTVAALNDLHAAIRLAPQHPEAHANLAHALFVTDAWQEAWPHFEFRFRRSARPVKLPVPVGMPRWSGDLATDQELWLIGEQGLGDQLQFARYARPLQDLGMRCVIACDPRLVALLSQSRLGARIVPFGAATAEAARHFPLMSLPGWHATRPDTVPCADGYLSIDRPRIERWQARLPPTGVRVALAWAGNPRMETGRYAGRSPPLAAFAPLLSVPDTHWISLQKGPGEDQLESVSFGRAIHRYADLDTGPDAFLDTAAVLKCVDLLVTSDSAIAHLAGALGVPTWLCLMREPDWRWMRHGEKTPWYTSLRLLRQPAAGDWDSVFAAVAADLRMRRVP